MFELTKYAETAKNLDEASGEDTMELLLFFSGFMTFIVIVPALYMTTGETYVALIGVLIGVFDLFASQYLPSRMNFEQEDEENEE
jgi:hypothetical protein